MRKRVNCPECGKELDSVGLSGHLYYAHQVPYQRHQSANLAANADTLPMEKEAKAVNYSELADTIVTALSDKIGMKQEANTVTKESDSKEHTTQDCPECRRRDFKIVDLEHELSQTLKSNAALQEQINANSDRLVEVPDLNTAIQHCESGECASHTKQWDQIKARIVQNAYDNLPPKAIPDKVVESEGLRRGFIPKKIIIPGRLVRDD